MHRNHASYILTAPQRIMRYIKSGREAGATLHLGGNRFGSEGYFINPTIFTNAKPDMMIVREEIFGPVAVVIKFEDEHGMHVFDFCQSWNLTTFLVAKMLSGRQMTHVRVLHCISECFGFMLSACARFSLRPRSCRLHSKYQSRVGDCT